MSPRNDWAPLPPRVAAAIARTALSLGAEIRAERLRRGWSLRDLAVRAGVSASMVHAIEAGETSSLEGYHRVAAPLGLRPQFTLLPERAAGPARAADPVHAAMGEIESVEIRVDPIVVRLDEPYQHFQFAGRADLIAHDPVRCALLHIENRTRFPDMQAFAGAYNAKRAYLADDLARRLGWHGLRSVTHVVVALWSSEVLHALRVRTATFRSICPDGPAAFAGWWAGAPPDTGTTSSLIVLDPLPGERLSRRRWIGLEDALAPRTEPRYRGYADALAALRAAGRA